MFNEMSTTYVTLAIIAAFAMMPAPSLLIAQDQAADSPAKQQIHMTLPEIQKGLSPYNWIRGDDYVATPICGASLQVAFTGTRSVVLDVDTSNLKTGVASRFPVVAWSVNGGAVQTHQLSAGDKTITLCTGETDPKIDFYVRGMSPFEDRFSGDVPVNAVKLTGFEIDAGGKVVPSQLPDKIWLNIGDSIMSGDAAAYNAGQGRPPDDAWAASDEARASYGYLVAQHYGYRDARLAWGGYAWTGGGGGNPALSELIDKLTSTVSRLDRDRLDPKPDVVLINLGENGVPPANSVTDALTKIRSRAGNKAKIILMIPWSGRGRKEIANAFSSYKESAFGDSNVFLVDLKDISYETADGQHPTANGHQTVYRKLVSKLDEIINN